MTEHERRVIADWRDAGNHEMADRLANFATEIDQLPPEYREHESELVFGRPSALRPVGILYNAR